MPKHPGLGYRSNPPKPKPKIRRAKAQPIYYRGLNPYRKRAPFFKRASTWVPIFLFIILGWLALMIYLPSFRISQVSYSGLKIIKQSEMEPPVSAILYRRSYWPSNNYFLVNANEIKQVLTKSFAVSNITVNKKFPGELQIEVTEKISSLIYDDTKNYYLLDQTGNIIKELTPVQPDEFNTSTSFVVVTSTDKYNTSTVKFTTTTAFVRNHTPNFFKIIKEFGDYPLVVDRTGPLLSKSPTSTPFTPNFINGILEIFRLTSNDPDFRPNYFSVQDPEAGVTVNTAKPWVIRFRPVGDIPAQIRNLRTIADQHQPKEYIDVRFAEHVYWK